MMGSFGLPSTQGRTLDSWTTALPEDAPLRLDLGDGGVFHVLEALVFLQVGLVHADRHRHVAVAVQGSV